MLQKKQLFWGLLLGGAALVFLIFVFFPAVAFLTFGGLVLAYLLFPLVEHFQKKHMPLQGAILLSYGMILVVLLFLCFVVFPVFYKECLGFLEKADVYLKYVANLWNWLMTKLTGIFAFMPFDSWEETFTAFLKKQVDAYTSSFLEGLTALPMQLSYLLLSPVVAYYFLRDHDRIGDLLLRLFPPKHRSNVLLLAKETDTVLWGFIKGNLFVSLVVGVMTGAGLWLLGVDYPLALGILAGLMDIIPYFGPLLSGIPIMLFALLQPDVNLLLVLILLVFVQQFENIVVSPRVIGDCVGLHPLWIILLVFVGGSFGGILGMVLVIPIASVAKVIGGFLYQQYVAYRFSEK